MTPPNPVSPWNSPQFGAPHTGTGPVLFDLQPYHAMRVLAGLAVALMLIDLPGIDFLLIAIGCGVGEWYTRTRHVVWPSDVAEVLARIRLANPKPLQGNGLPYGTPGGRATPPRPVAPIVPLRSLTIPELLSGAMRIVLKNWPTLVGIPVAILVVFGGILAIVMTVMSYVFFQTAMSAAGSMVGGTPDFGGLISGFVTMVIVMYVIVWAIALPADALLIGSSVIATDKAVRGEPVRVGDVFQLAWARVFALCRMTLTFYAIFVIPEYLIFLVVGLTAGFYGAGFILLWFVLFGVAFVLGILFSLAPIVLVVEKRGVLDSLRRSMQLAKPAAGRLIGIHLLWVACVVPLVFLTIFISVFVGFLGLAVLFLGLPVLIAYFRSLQMLIYTDLRIRQENYDRELIADWTRNTTV